MSKSETLEGLERALQVIRFLELNSIASLHEIFIATHISKSSLLRILKTLERAGLVSRRLVDGGYRLSGTLTHLARKRDRVAEAAAPVLERLCLKISWPSDLLVPAGDHMEVRETSRTHSPLVLHLNHVGRHVGWLETAVGRAYLAFCSTKERQQILEQLRRSGKPDDWLAHEPRRLDGILAETRERGYATRDPSFHGRNYGGPPVDDRLAAIAVPLLDGKRVHASINILWIRKAFTTDRFAALHLDHLRTAAQEIVQSLRKRPSKG
jgi:IclR family transcriptional regulator, mhp operon transcriptional activator